VALAAGTEGADKSESVENTIAEPSLETWQRPLEVALRPSSDDHEITVGVPKPVFAALAFASHHWYSVSQSLHWLM
jgi:hypothetical protein